MFQHRLWSLWPSGRLHTSQVCGAPEALAAPGARWDGELGVSTVALGVVKPPRPRPLSCAELSTAGVHRCGDDLIDVQSRGQALTLEDLPSQHLGPPRDLLRFPDLMLDAFQLLLARVLGYIS